jgi:hypothetical protein
LSKGDGLNVKGQRKLKGNPNHIVVVMNKVVLTDIINDSLTTKVMLD